MTALLFLVGGALLIGGAELLVRGASRLAVARQLVRLDVPLMIAASVGALLLALDGRVGRLDGALLFSAVIVYTGFLVWHSRRETRDSDGTADSSPAAGDPDQPGDPAQPTRWAWNVLLVGIGLGLLVVGARWLVSAAVTTAEALGVSSLVIGLTIVAAGTSLPEVATSVLASVRGQRDIAVGTWSAATSSICWRCSASAASWRRPA